MIRDEEARCFFWAADLVFIPGVYEACHQVSGPNVLPFTGHGHAGSAKVLAVSRVFAALFLRSDGLLSKFPFSGIGRGRNATPKSQSPHNSCSKSLSAR